MGCADRQNQEERKKCGEWYNNIIREKQNGVLTDETTGVRTI